MANKNYYVMFIDDRPIPVYGPHRLNDAKDFARIGSQFGRSRRMVTRGLNGQSVRVYQDGHRRWPRTAEEVATAELKDKEIPDDLNPYLPEKLEKRWDDQPIGWLAETVTVDLSGLNGENS